MSEGAVFLDVGANIGLFTLFALERRPDAFVHAFEPAPAMVDLLDRPRPKPARWTFALDGLLAGNAAKSAASS